jgi:hypothetical protein
MNKSKQDFGYTERINYLIEKKARGNTSEFARMIDIPEPTIRFYTKRRPPKAFAITAMAQTFQNLNVRWLATGKGEPFQEPSTEGSVSRENELLKVLNKSLKDQVEMLKAEVQRLKEGTQ